MFRGPRQLPEATVDLGQRAPVSAQSGGALGSVKTFDSEDLGRLCWLLSPQLSLLLSPPPSPLSL